MPSRTEPVHPLPPARTPARSHEALAVPARQPSTPRRVGLTQTLGQARTLALVPRRGRGSNLCRPKATELSESSTCRRSCSSPAASPTGKPAGDPAARAPPKLHSRGRSSLGGYPRVVSRRSYRRRSRAQPPGHPERLPCGLATRVVGAEAVAKSGEQHRGVALCRHRSRPKPFPGLPRQPSAETNSHRDTYTSTDDECPKATVSSTRRFVQRTASHLLTRLQKQPVRAGRPAPSEDGRVAPRIFTN